MARSPSDSDTWDPDAAPRGGASDTWDPDGPEDAPAEPEVPVADRYDEGPVVGQGGMADVRSARDRRLGREVAVKRLRDASRPRTRARFLREARVAAQLEHPGIVPVHDVDVDRDGIPFYTMRFVRGEPMSDALERATELDQRLVLLPDMLSICQAMAYAHEQGILHRDLKPQNVMLGPFGESVVVDWGLARRVDDEADVELDEVAGSSPVSTRVGTVHGTPAYMAPEQARGEPVGRPADVYALGAMLYEVLTGRPPRGGAQTAEEQLSLARTGDHVAVLTLQPTCPRDLAAIAERALSTAPADRYASAAGMARDLERWTQGRFVEAHAYTAMERLLNLYRRYRVPLFLVLVGLLTTSVVATVGAVRTRAERDRAVASEGAALAAADEARRRTATLLVSRGDRALHDGDTVAARAFAVSALELEPSTAARGLLLAAWGAPDVRSLPDLPLPHGCRDLLAMPGGLDVLCVGADTLSRVAADGTVRWRLPVDVDAERNGLLLGAAPAAEVVWLVTGSEVVGIDPDVGSVVARHASTRARGLVPVGDQVWWIDGDNGVRSSGGFSAEIPGSFVSALLAPPEGEVPRVVRGVGRIETLEGVEVEDVFRVSFAALAMPDRSIWTLGARSVALPPDGGAPQRLGVERATLFAGRQRDGLTALGATDGSVFVTAGTDPSGLVRVPSSGNGPPRFDVRRVGGVGELLLADGRRVRRWAVDQGRPPVHLLDDVWRKQAVAPDGRSWLRCGTDGRFVWFDPKGVLRGQVDGEGFPLMCAVVDGAPYALWKGGKLYRVGPGEPARVDAPLGVRGLFGHQGRLLSVVQGRVMHGEQVLGGTVLETDGELLVALEFEGTAPSKRVTWRWRTDRYELEASVTLPLGTLHVLSSGAIARRSGDDVVVEHGADALRLQGHTGRAGHAVELPGGRLATAGLDGRVLVWNLADGALEADLDLGGGRVGSLEYLPEPKLLVASTFDGGFHVLGVEGIFEDPVTLSAQLRARLGMAVVGGELVLVGGAP